MATDNTNVINLAKYIAARVAEHEQEGKKDYEWLEERWQCALIQGRAIDGMRALGSTRLPSCASCASQSCFRGR